MFRALVNKALRATGKVPGPCPSAEMLAAYAERQGTVEERLTVEDHLSACEHCLDQVLLCMDLASGWETNERADAVITFLSRTVEIIKGVGQIRVLSPGTLSAVRGGRTVFPNAARFARSFGDTEVQVEVERTRERTGDITVDVCRDDSPVDGVRCTLVGNGRELASELSEHGRVRFEGVSFDRYLIRLAKQGEPLGEFSLVLKEE